MKTIYEVWLLGDTEDGDATDFDHFIKDFETEKEALDFAENVHVLNEVISTNPIGKENVAIVRLVVEECEVTEDGTECVDVLYETELEWITKRKNYKCGKCGGDLFASQVSDYYAQCFNCDEDFYRFECERKELSTKTLNKKYMQKRANCCKCGMSLEDWTGMGLGSVFVLDKFGNYYCTNCDTEFEDVDDRIFEYEE